MFLTLRAKLPFHDVTKNKIIARILRQSVQMVDPNWGKISKEAKDLISKLLIKNPGQRISCVQAMKHSWFDPVREEAEYDGDAAKRGIGSAMAKDEFVEVGHSVHDIKVYSQHSMADDDDDEEQQHGHDEEEAQNPVTLIKQKSIHDLNQY